MASDKGVGPFLRALETPALPRGSDISLAGVLGLEPAWIKTRCDAVSLHPSIHRWRQGGEGLIHVLVEESVLKVPHLFVYQCCD